MYTYVKEARVLTVLIILAVALAVLDFASSRYGRDSRDGNDWFDHTYEVGQR
jgi:hypothetical protein